MAYIYSIYGLNHEIKSTCKLLYELKVGVCPSLMVYTNIAEHTNWVTVLIQINSITSMVYQVPLFFILQLGTLLCICPLASSSSLICITQPNIHTSYCLQRSGSIA